MSEYTFGYGDPGMDPGAEEPAPDSAQGPKWFREHMDKVSGQLADLRAENDRLQAERRQTQVADALKTQGYTPEAAKLYTGKPEELGDWLKAHGGVLAKLPDPQEGASEGEVPPAGPPASTVPAEDQQAMARMQQAGNQGVSPPQGADAEVAANLRAAKSLDELNALMKAQGNPYIFD